MQTPSVELIVVMTTDVGVGLLKSHLLQIKQLCNTTLDKSVQAVCI